MDFLFLFFYHLSHKGSPRILEWVAIPLLQGIFPTQGPNQRVPHCRKVLHYLSHQGSPTYRGRGCLSCPVSFFILCAAPLEIWLDLVLSLLSPVPYRFSSCVLEIWLDPIQSVSVSLCHPYLPPSLLLLLHDLANFPGHSLQTKPPTPSPLHPGESQRAGHGIPASSCGPQLWLSTDELLGSPFPTCPSWLPPHSSQKYLVVDLMVIIQFIFDLWNRRE